MIAPSPATGGSLTGAGGWGRALPGVVLAAGAMAVYLGSLANGFVYDDHAQVAGNPWLRSPAFLPEVFSSHVWGFEPGPVTNYYRPLVQRRAAKQRAGLPGRVSNSSGVDTPAQGPGWRRYRP